jgi:hypothetical protein
VFLWGVGGAANVGVAPRRPLRRADSSTIAKAEVMRTAGGGLDCRAMKPLLKLWPSRPLIDTKNRNLVKGRSRAD